MAKFQRIIKKRKSFTLIEMLVTIFVLVMMLGVASVSINTGRGSSTVGAQADEITGLVDELKSYAYGPERERATQYVLIIHTNPAASVAYCNKGLSDVNKLSKNQYMICASDEKNLPAGLGSLNSRYSRVRAGSLNQDLNIKKSADFYFTPLVDTNPIVINIRTYDGQIGYRLQYCDKDSSFCGSPTITLDQSGISKILTLNSILGTFR